MDYDAITLDTNVFIKQGLRLEDGILGELRQFREGSVQLVLSDTTIEEIKRHMIARITDAISSVKSAIHEAHKLKAFDSSFQPDNIVNAIGDPKDICQTRVQHFLNETGAKIASSENISAKYISSMYFNNKPPFGATKKKNEFPDAIALASLEKWSKKYDCYILAVSDDLDWASFGRTSDRIEVRNNLADVLELFQVHARETRERMAELLESVERDAQRTTLREMESLIETAIEPMDIDINAYSHHRLEVDSAEISILDLRLRDNYGNLNFRIVRSGRNHLASEVRCLVDINIGVTFYLFAYDSIDGDEVNLGDIFLEKAISLDAVFLLSAQKQEEGYELSVIECRVAETNQTLEFGDIDRHVAESWQDSPGIDE